MNKNPFDLLDLILGDWASPRVRRTVHAIIALILLLVAVWQASDGNWETFVFTLVGALYAGANKANTHPDPEPEYSEEVVGALPVTAEDDSETDPFPDAADVSEDPTADPETEDDSKTSP